MRHPPPLLHTVPPFLLPPLQSNTKFLLFAHHKRMMDEIQAMLASDVSTLFWS